MEKHIDNLLYQGFNHLDSQRNDKVFQLKIWAQSHDYDLKIIDGFKGKSR